LAVTAAGDDDVVEGVVALPRQEQVVAYSIHQFAMTPLS
jgi:hypothetical protein